METPLYDTSLLIRSMRAGATSINGATTILNLIEFPKAALLKDLDIIIPGPRDYDTGYELSVMLLNAGTPIPAVDIIIAAVAINHHYILHTLDKHFDYVRKVNNDLQVHFG